MIVNNFNEIKELLIKEDPNDFWFGQIIKRKKDNPFWLTIKMITGRILNSLKKCYRIRFLQTEN